MEIKTCPICKKKTPQKKNPFWPFCSERCKLIDLGKWASEDYRVPGGPVDVKNLEDHKNGEDEE